MFLYHLSLGYRHQKENVSSGRRQTKGFSQERDPYFFLMWSLVACGLGSPGCGSQSRGTRNSSGAMPAPGHAPGHARPGLRAAGTGGCVHRG